MASLPQKRPAEGHDDWVDTPTATGTPTAATGVNGHKHARTNEPIVVEPERKEKKGGFRGKKAPANYARDTLGAAANHSSTSGHGSNASIVASMTSSFTGTGSEFDEQRHLLVRQVGIRDGEQKIRDRRLPGPLPATLGRLHLTHKLNGHEYWVCEKSDGERAMLLATNVGVWLIDRKFAFRSMMPQWSSLCTSLCNKGPLLLDGELVHGLESKDPASPPAGERYMVFDAIAVDGNNVSDQPHSARRRAIMTALKTLTTPILPPILVKKFVKPTDLAYLFSKITRDSSGHWIYNGGAYGMNRNDGIVFTPEHNDYLCKARDISLLKWKWPGMNTIDFKVRAPFNFRKNQVDLYAGGPGGHDIMVRSAVMSQHDREDIINRTSAANLQSVIVECAFDTAIGTWCVKGYRLDKTDANFITTVMATMENIAENVTREELIAAFPQSIPASSSSSSSSS